MSCCYKSFSVSALCLFASAGVPVIMASLFDLLEIRERNPSPICHNYTETIHRPSKSFAPTFLVDVILPATQNPLYSGDAEMTHNEVFEVLMGRPAK